MLPSTISFHICPKCNLNKPLIAYCFNIRNDNKKFRNICRDCSKIYSKYQNIKNKTKLELQRIEWKKKNPNYYKFYKKPSKTKHAEQQKRWALNNPSKIINNSLVHNYGITLKMKEKMFNEQNGVCLISKLPLISVREAHLDHDHKNGKIKGLLFSKINQALGLFMDDPIIIQNTIDYLNNYQHKLQINCIIFKNKPLYNIINKNWSKNEKQRNINLKNYYNISLWDYYDILQLQNNECFISNKKHTEKQKLSVDHCHKTGQIRGLINNNINVAIGMFQDNINWMRNSIFYLKHYHPPTYVV